jgi:hypothetical protein
MRGLRRPNPSTKKPSPFGDGFLNWLRGPQPPRPTFVGSFDLTSDTPFPQRFRLRRRLNPSLEALIPHTRAHCLLISGAAVRANAWPRSTLQNRAFGLDQCPDRLQRHHGRMAGDVSLTENQRIVPCKPHLVVAARVAVGPVQGIWSRATRTQTPSLRMLRLVAS